MDKTEFMDMVEKSLPALVSNGELGLGGYMWVLMNSGVSVMALDLSPPECWELFLVKVVEENVQAAAFVLDRYAKEEQGTTCDSVLTGVSYEKPDTFSYFIMEYNQDGSTLPLNWENEFWESQMLYETMMTIIGLKSVREDEVNDRPDPD